MLKDSLKTIALSLITLSILGIAYAWTEPTSTPPSGNVTTPINTNGGQIVEGGLVLGNNSSVTNGLIVKNGNVGIGTTTPTAKLEIGGTAGVDGIKFPDGTVQTSASGSSFVTGTYIGNGVDNREIAIGFQPDDVEVGTTQDVNYFLVRRNKHMTGGYSFYTANTDTWATGAIKSFTTNGFTIGTAVHVNELGRSYWYNAFKGGTPPAPATPIINSFSISPSPIGIEQSTTINWASSGASYCAASGNNWSGNKTASGSASITPSSSGILTYTITCYNDSGQSVASSTTVDVRNWQGVTGSGNGGESCNSWLSRTGQAGINGSVPGVFGKAFGTQVGNCLYGSAGDDVRDTYPGFMSFGGGGQGIQYYGPLPSSNSGDSRIFPFYWHCCGDAGNTEANTSTRR